MRSGSTVSALSRKTPPKKERGVEVMNGETSAPNFNFNRSPWMGENGMSSKKDTLTENRLAGLVIKGWKGWADRIEPASGSTVGFPDLMLFHKNIGHLPVELKVARLNRHGIMDGVELRPAQIRWHKSFHDCGGLSAIIVGAQDEDGGIEIGIANGRDAQDLNEGLNILKLLRLKEITPGILLWVGANRRVR